MTKPIEIPETAVEAAIVALDGIPVDDDGFWWSAEVIPPVLQAALPHLKAAWEEEIRERLLSDKALDGAAHAIDKAEYETSAKAAVRAALDTALEQEEETR